jgi:hypothetical protein
MARRVIGAALAAMALWFGGTAFAAELRIAPHRAAYVLALADGKAGGIVGVEGAMTVDWQETCDGWTMAQRMRFRMIDSDDEAIETDIFFSSWEAADGTAYRFTLRNSREGEVVEELRGRAMLAGPDKGGKAVFVDPPDEVIELAPGTLFPTAHTLFLIARAKAGDRQVARPVFDGASIEGAMDVSAVISAPVSAATAPRGPGIAADLLRGTSWRFRMAFFRADDQRGSEPEYETTMRLFENGVGTDFLFDYPEFSIRARLDRLEAVTRPRC